MGLVTRAEFWAGSIFVRLQSAWIIDGQHRLFGYSGSKLAPPSRLAVMAFAGLKPG